jgi:hypothetical protein
MKEYHYYRLVTLKLTVRCYYYYYYYARRFKVPKVSLRQVQDTSILYVKMQYHAVKCAVSPSLMGFCFT